MKLAPIIKHIRQYCPSFGGRVGGAAEFSGLTENTSMQTPAAYVIPLEESASEEAGGTGYQQQVSATFGVVVVCSARSDERGQQGIEGVDALKSELFQAILGWTPDEEHQGLISFESGTLLELNRSRIFYQFEFGCEYLIETDDTWMGVRDEGLPKLNTVDIEIHGIDGDAQTEEVAHVQFTHLNEG